MPSLGVPGVFPANGASTGPGRPNRWPPTVLANGSSSPWQLPLEQSRHLPGRITVARRGDDVARR